MVRIGITILALCLISTAQSNGQALYQQAINKLSGSVTQRSPIDAADLMRKAADAGYAPAQTALGYWLENGEVVAQSHADAVEQYRRAAKQSDPFGEYALGRAYALGIGVPKDESQAQTWLKKAADKGDPFAKFYMALVNESRDPQAYVSWLQKAAADGIPQAFSRLGMALLDGRYVTRDTKGAYMWLLIAQQNGWTDVDNRLGSLESEIGTDADALRAAARDRADALRSKRQGSGCTGWDGERDDLPTLAPPTIQRSCR